MKWLSSLDELLYEVMSWLLFFPLTLWRAVFQPIKVMEQVDREAALPDDQQYAAILSPPLFLALALLMGHSVATALGQTDKIIANHHGLAGLVDDNASALVLRVIVFAAFPLFLAANTITRRTNASALVLRVIVFAAFPLFLAARLMRRREIKLDRASLRLPFYEQCYPAAVFALGISVGTSLISDNHDLVRGLGRALVIGSIANFWMIETRWFVKVLEIGYLRAAGNVFIGLFEGALFLIGVAFLFTR